MPLLHPSAVVIAALALGALAVNGPLAAQAPAAAATPPAGARLVAGEVVDAGSGLGIEGATVVLLPAGAGAAGGVLTGDPAAGPYVAATRSAVTDATGRYRFDGVAAGAYTLRVIRLGFRPATVDIELRGDGGPGAGARVSVGLTVVPIRLRPVEVTGAAPEPFARHARTAKAAGDARLAALRQRQSRYLSTDVREVTQADVAEGVALGETDLFRALQRLPGVSTRNDLTAELWTRGGRWDQTRVTWDGLPLFNPVHAMGLLSAVNADAVGAAFLHAGVRPAAIGEGGAAVLDLRSRAGGGDGHLRGVGEVSFLSARATLDQRVAGGRGAWMLSARRSYADWAVPALARSLGADPMEARFPFHFAELAARGDWQLGRGYALEVSALRSQDHLTGDVADIVQRSRARWGNTLARATLAGPARLGRLGPVTVRHTLGLSDYDGRTRVGIVDSAVERRYSAGSMSPVQGRVRYLSLAGEVAPADGGWARWSAGWELSRQSARAEGALRLGYTLDPTDSTTGRLAGAVTQLAVWGERRVRPTPRLTVAAGLRAEGGTPVPGAGPFGNGPLGAVRLAPRLTARYAVGDSQTFVSAGAGRSFQYVQASPRSDVAGNLGAEVRTPIPLWGVAGAAGEGVAAGAGGVPVLRTDLYTVGAERWIGGGWHAAANAYRRRAAGVLLDDPRPGPVLRTSPLFVVGGAAARGVELSVRKLTGRWTAGGNYALARTRARAAGLTYAPPQDQRHVASATTMWRVGGGLRLGAAYTTASGAPFTRGTDARTYQFAHYAPDGRGGVTVVTDSVVHHPAVREAPGAGRFPRAARLDALVDWSGRIRRVRAGAYLQVHNALFRRDNPLFLESGQCGFLPGGMAVGPGGNQLVPASGCLDTFQRSFPVAPVIGVRLSF